jgi:transcriptional repressor NrdR
MRCPRCTNAESRVVDSRPGHEGGAIRRRRECERCGHRFNTWERVDGTEIVVVKRDGRREPWDREKIRQGLRIACRKRPVPVNGIERVVERVEVRMAGRAEVGSEDIGRAVLDELARLDEVAWVRFASVYLRFASLEEFERFAADARARADAPTTAELDLDPPR